MPRDLRRALADRVYYGWVIAVACFLASVAVFGTTYAFGVFYDVFAGAFSGSTSLVAAVFGVQTALLYTSGIVAGRVIARRGRRVVAAGSGVLLVAGLVWTAAARSFPELLAAYGVVVATGLGGLYVVGYATLPAWFDRRRGVASILASAGLGLGLVVIPPGANAAIDAFGWRVAVLALAGFVAVLSILIVALLADDPADVGADTSVEFGADAATDGRGTADTTDEAAGGDVRAVVSSAPFVVTFVGWTLVFAPMFVVFGHVVRHAEAVGVGRSTGVLAVAVVGVSTTAGRLVLGPVADRFGRPTTFAASAAVLGSAVVALSATTTATPFLVAIAVFALGYAGCGGLIGAVTADLFGSQALDTLFGVLSMSFALSGLLAPPLAGLWFERTGDYRLALLAFGLAGVAGAGCVVLGTRLARDQRKV